MGSARHARHARRPWRGAPRATSPQGLGLVLLVLLAWQRPLVASDDRIEAAIRVRSYRGGPTAPNVLEICAGTIARWNEVWGGDDVPPWSPPCEIVLHRDRGSYLSVVGRAGGGTTGSSLVRRLPRGGMERRIDLLVAADGSFSALPHELVHVLLADRFGGRLPPLWLDEGVAMWWDSLDKQRRHWDDCEKAWVEGRQVPLVELLSIDSMPPTDRLAAVYGESLTLTRFLASRGEPSQLLELPARAEQIGYRRAIVEIYDLPWEALEAEWRAYVAAHRPDPATSLGAAREPRASDGD